MLVFDPKYSKYSLEELNSDTIVAFTFKFTSPVLILLSEYFELSQSRRQGNVT